jgi:hypothetical protein
MMTDAVNLIDLAASVELLVIGEQVMADIVS